MQAGRLRHRLQLQQLQAVQDTDDGTVAEAWADVDTVWAEIVPLSGRELMAAASVQASVNTRITIRWREGVVPTMRGLHQGEIFNIKAVLPDPTLRRWLTLMCESGVNNG